MYVTSAGSIFRFGVTEKKINSQHYRNNLKAFDNDLQKNKQRKRLQASYAMYHWSELTIRSLGPHLLRYYHGSFQDIIIPITSYKIKQNIVCLL